MKKLVVKILMIAVGVAFTISMTMLNAKANPGSKNESKVYEERMIKAESYFQEPTEPAVVFQDTYKVYDPNQDLVYESQDKNDPKLLKLIGKSDILVEINNTHIYQLSR